MSPRRPIVQQTIDRLSCCCFRRFSLASLPQFFALSVSIGFVSCCIRSVAERYGRQIDKHWNAKRNERDAWQTHTHTHTHKHIKNTIEWTGESDKNYGDVDRFALPSWPDDRWINRRSQSVRETVRVCVWSKKGTRQTEHMRRVPWSFISTSSLLRILRGSKKMCGWNEQVTLCLPS